MEQTLKERLRTILAKSDFLNADPNKRISGTELLAKVKADPLIRGEGYSDNSIRQTFSVLAADRTSPIASFEGGGGYFRREQSADETESETPTSRLAGRDHQPEEKFRALFIRHRQSQGEDPLHVEHTEAGKSTGGLNKWKYPDVVLLKWEVLSEPKGDKGKNDAQGKERRFDEAMLKVRTTLGHGPFQLTSAELKVEAKFGSLRENFFQCVSNSKWAHAAELVFAMPVSDKELVTELRRLGASYGVTVKHYGFSKDDVAKLPPASKILEMPEGKISGLRDRCVVTTLQSAPLRNDLDWEHLRDVSDQIGAFRDLLEWVARCLDQKCAYSFEDFIAHRKKYGR